jgi:hypothetical protein
MAFRVLRSLGFLVSSLCLAGCGDGTFSELGAEPDWDFQAEGTATENAELIATEVYGPLYVEPGRFVGESSIKPWSSWWYPIWENTFFAPSPKGDAAPLQKYDRYCRKVLNRNTSAADIERTQIYDPRAAGWSGLCHAWALASIMEPEPKQEVSRSGIRFTVGDQKGLLLKTYDNVTGLKRFGERNNARWNDDYSDIDPNQFHRFLQAELFENKLPFLMDHDAGYEVWHAPVWKAITRIEQSKDEPDVVHVQTWLASASPHVEDRDFTGTLEVIRSYTYDLTGEWETPQRLLVRSGQWTHRSRWDHPDFLIPKPTFVKRQSRNTEIDVAAVDFILKKKP